MSNITGGKYKRTKLAIPNNFVRPTSALKREAIFSIVESYAIKNSIEIYNNKSIICSIRNLHDDIINVRSVPLTFDSVFN